MSRAVIGLVLAAFVTGACSHGAQRGAIGPRGTLLRLPSTPTAFGLNGSRFAWVGDRVVVADLDSGKRILLARGGSEYEAPVAVAGSTVVWLQILGGNSKVDTLRAAAPGRQSRFGRWGDDDYYLESGPLFGGVAADGKTLVYDQYVLTSVERKSDRCYERGSCHWNVTGGGTFLVSPGSLSRRRILPPAKAVAVDGHTVAAALLTRGARYDGRAQIVLVNLSDGSRRLLERPADVAQLLLDGDRLAAVIVHKTGLPFVRIWNVRTRQLIRTLRLPSSTKLEHFGLTGGRIVFRAFSRGAAIMSIDLRTGRPRVVARIHANFDYGPWILHGRALWIEERYRGRAKAYSLVRSAPLP